MNIAPMPNRLTTSSLLAMRFLFRRILILCLLLPAIGSAAQPLQPDSERLDIGNHMEILLNADENLTLEQAMQASGWQPDGADILRQTRRGSVLWLRFSIAPLTSGKQERWLEIQRPSAAEQLAFYTPETLQVYLPQSGPSPLPIEHYRNAIIKLTLSPETPLTLYLRVDNRQTTIKRIVLWEADAFVQGSITEEWLWGLRTGISLLLGLVSIWFYRATRDGFYLTFSAYLFCAVIANLAAASLIRNMLGDDHLETINQIRFISTALLIAACMHFVLRFLGLTVRYPRLTRALLVPVYVVAAFSIVISLCGYFALAITIIAHSFVIAAPVCLLIILAHVIRGHNEIRLPLLTLITCGGVAIVIQFLASQGYVRIALFDYSTTIMSTILCLMIFHSITKRHQRLREANEAAQHRILQMMRESERELERQVASRTQELMVAMEEVEKALSQERAAQEEQKQFIAMVSHELRTPLAIIDAAAQNVSREESQLSPKSVQRMDKIRRSTERLSSLFSQYLNGERLKMFSQPVRYDNVTLLPMLEDTVNMMRSLTGKHSFRIDTEQARMQVRADADILRLALGTLVNNATKYTPAGTTIVLRATPVAEGWHIDIADNGPGIPSEERDAIFNRYYRGRAAGSQAGTGLGLALARHLIERHGGTLILLETTEPGATFRIFLPA